MMDSCWYNQESPLVAAIRERRTNGASYRDLVGLLEEHGIHCPVHSLRRIFSQKGWHLDHSEDAVVDYAKSRITVLKERALLKERVDGMANWEYFVDAVERVVETREPKTDYAPVPPFREEWPVVHIAALLGDVHAGQFVQAKEVGERLAYGPEQLSERMLRWQLGLSEIIFATQQSSIVEHVAIIGLGDYIENALMREGAARYTYETNAEAVVEFCEQFCDAMELALLAWHPDLTWSIDFTNGNHDEIRCGGKGQTHAWESYGYIIAHYIKHALKDYEQVEVYAHTEDSVLLQLGANDILVLHGHTTSGGAFPYAALEALVDRYSSFHRSQAQFAVCGHYHHGASWVTNSGVQCVMNPAFADTNSFAAKGALLNKAGQKVLIFKDEGGLYAEHTIPLSDPPEASKPHKRGRSA